MICFFADVSGSETFCIKMRDTHFSLQLLFAVILPSLCFAPKGHYLNRSSVNIPICKLRENATEGKTKPTLPHWFV